MRLLRAPDSDQTGQGTECAEPSPGLFPNPRDLGPGFCCQAAAADVAGGGSRWQHAGSGKKQAGLVTRQGARKGAKKARNAKCASFVAMVLGRARQAAGEQSQASWVCKS